MSAKSVVARNRRRRPRNQSLYKKVNYLARQVSLIRAWSRPEPKRSYHTSADGKIANAWTFETVNLLAPGTAYNQRLGEEVYAKELLVRGNIYYNGGVDIVAIRVFVDTNPNGAVLGAATDYLVSDTWDSYTSTGGSQRFWTLRSRIYPVTNVGNDQMRVFNYRIPLNFKCGYAYNTLGTIADMNLNAIKIGYCSKTNLYSYVGFRAEFIYTDA